MENVMNLHHVLGAFVACVALVPGGSHGAEPDAEPVSGYVVRNAEMRQAVQAIAKGFCIDLRDFHTGESLTGRHADSIRGGLDPHYMARHGLEEGELPIVTAPFRDIHDIRVADDLRTVLCIVNTEEGGREVIVLKLDGEEGETYSTLYFSPVNPPDAESGFFEPWILKVAPE